MTGLVAALAVVLVVAVVMARRDRRRESYRYAVGACRTCGSVVRLGPDLRVLHHNPPGPPHYRLCMGSYLVPVVGSVEYVTEEAR